MREADVQLRYASVREFLARNRRRGDAVLEVGGGVAGIAQFSAERVTGCDPYFLPRRGTRADWQGRKPLPNILPIGGMATRIPLPTNHFPFVVSSDMLEHLPKHQRRTAIREMLRVSSRYVVLNFPSGSAAAQWERRLFAWGKSLTGKEHRWIKEHLAYGLPTEPEVTKFLNGLAFQQNGNGNVWLWALMTMASALWAPLGWLCYPLIRWVNIPPYYRTRIIIRK